MTNQRCCQPGGTVFFIDRCPLSLFAHTVRVFENKTEGKPIGFSVRQTEIDVLPKSTGIADRNEYRVAVWEGPSRRPGAFGTGSRIKRAPNWLRPCRFANLSRQTCLLCHEKRVDHSNS